MFHDGCGKATARYICTIRNWEGPVKEWLKRLGRQDRLTIGTDMKTVEYGWHIGMPTCRSLGKGLWEVRSNISDGRIARVIFCVVGDDMILLHGFIKKTQKMPKGGLDIALERKRLMAD